MQHGCVRHNFRCTNWRRSNRKKVIYKNDLMILEASNPKYASRYFTPEEVDSIPVRILGKVRFVRTDF